MTKVRKIVRELSPQEREILSLLRAELKRRLGANFVSLSLFGSRARGEARAESDYDLLLVVKRMTPSVNDVVEDASMHYLLERNKMLSIVVYSQAEFRRFARIPTVFMQLFRQDALRV